MAFGLGKLAVLESKLDIYEDLSKEMLDKLERAVGTISENSNKIAIILERHEGRLDEVPGIFSLMTPIKDAIQSVEKLSKVYDTYLLSTAPWENPSAWSDKLIWVKKYLGEVAYKNSENTAESDTSNSNEEINKDDKKNEDVVDADFEEVKPEDDKKNAS